MTISTLHKYSLMIVQTEAAIYFIYYNTLEKRLFSRPCRQLVGLTPNLFLFVIFALHDIPICYQDITLVTNVFPFCHQGLSLYSPRVSLWSPRVSLWSPRFFPLVAKVFPLVTKDQGFTPSFHLHSFEVKCDEEQRTNEELTDRTESRTMSVISLDDSHKNF